MRIRTKHFVMAFVGLGLLAGEAYADPVTFLATDPGAGPGSARPNSDAMAATFDAAAAAIGPIFKFTFENASLGSFHNLTASGVSINGTDANGVDQTIRNTSNLPAAPSLDGFNTTAGGSQFVEMIGGNLVFTFAQPTQFFGAYLTGVQTVFFSDTFTFSDGTSQTLTIPQMGTSNMTGGVAFVGFTDAGKSISSVTINAGIPDSHLTGSDDIGVDDVRYQTQSVPEPSVILNFIVGGLVCSGYIVRRRQSGRKIAVR